MVNAIAPKAPIGAALTTWYTGGFAGTSAAAPMVAGALACVQGVLRAEGRTPLDPAQARAALRETGSPQQAAADGSLQPIGNRPDIGQLIDWAMEATRPARPTTPRPRRASMKVTITIEDDGEGRIDWGDAPEGSTEGSYVKGPHGPYVKGPYVKGPYVKGPSLVIPHEDGTETHLDIAALESAAPKREDA